MKQVYITVCFSFLLFCKSLFSADHFDSTSMHFVIQAINELATTGTPSLSITTATGGLPPDDDVDSTTTFDITTNEASKKITASLNLALPTGITLNVLLAAVGGGHPMSVDLSTSVTDVQNGIGNVASSSNTITYTMSATVDANADPAISRTVTYTITDDV